MKKSDLDGAQDLRENYRPVTVRQMRKTLSKVAATIILSFPFDY
jgi:hypothetical protein